MSIFSACLSQCGLNLHDAATLLGQSFSLVEKKSRGKTAMTYADSVTLTALYRRIRAGKVEGLTKGSQETSAALRMLVGVLPFECAPRPRKPGEIDPLADIVHLVRPPATPSDTPVTPTAIDADTTD